MTTSSEAGERLRQLAAEADRRNREALRVYRPAPQQLPFHLSHASERIVRGGKRSGKSMSVAMEFASLVTGQPILAPDGQPIKPRHPVPTTKNPRIYWIIGWDTKHIGQTLHKLLFQRGMGGTFRIIRDQATGEWRTFSRSNPSDVMRHRQSVLAEPLIPERFVIEKSWDWENKAAKQFNSVELTTGAKIFAYPSSARSPKQGDAVSGIWIDEDIQFPAHLKEWQDRLTDEVGWFMWSVWPHSKNEALLSLLDRAELAADEPKPQIQSFQLVMTDNPHLTEMGKRQSLSRMETDEEIARRNRGDLLMDEVAMFDFNHRIHCVRKAVQGERGIISTASMDAIRTVLADAGKFPRQWTRYLSIDPSHTRTAVHSWVVPPVEWNGVRLGRVCIAEWELVAKKYSADQLAKELSERMAGLRYENFVMDQMAGRQTHAGREENTFEVYATAFEKHKIMSRQSHFNFVPGVNVLSTRYRAVRDLLTINDTGIPSLMIVEDTCLETKREFGRYRKKRINTNGEEVLMDEPANPRIFDCMASVEYFSAYILPQFVLGTAYVEPSQYKSEGSAAYQAAQRMIQKAAEKTDGQYVHLGPGHAA